MCDSFYYFFLHFLRWQVTILWSHWCSLFQTLNDSAHRFQSQDGSIIACALLSPAHDDPQSHLWIPRPGPGPNFTPWHGEATAGVTTNGSCSYTQTFYFILFFSCRTSAGRKRWTHDPQTEGLATNGGLCRNNAESFPGSDAVITRAGVHTQKWCSQPGIKTARFLCQTGFRPENVCGLWISPASQGRNNQPSSGHKWCCKHHGVCWNTTRWHLRPSGEASVYVVFILIHGFHMDWKMGKHFPVREFWRDWKIQGILSKILEKSGNFSHFFVIILFFIFNWSVFVK